MWERITGEESGQATPKIRVHAFMAALGEWERGRMTRAQVIAAFALTAQDEADLDELFGKITPSLEVISFGALVTLTNVGTAYDAIAAAKGLGFARIEGLGLTSIEYCVRYNKVAAGASTLSWQLWDDTTGSQIGVIDDAAAAGDNRQGVITITPASPLPAGLHTIRTRVKSTVAADDPVYYGSCVRIRRAEVVHSEVLHECLLLAERRIAPLDSAAALKTRLGI